MDLESALVAARAGDDAAFGRLYDDVAPAVLGVAMWVLGDRHEAEDVVHEALHHARRTAGAFDPSRGTARSWLLALTHRRAVERLRSGGGARLTQDERGQGGASAGTPPRARVLLRRLPHEQGRVLELAYSGRHTGHEIAQLVGLPLATAQALIRDGLHALRLAAASDDEPASGAPC